MCLEITVYFFLLFFFIWFCYIHIHVCLCVAQTITNFYFKRMNTLLCTFNCVSWSMLNLTYLFSVHSAIWFNRDVHYTMNFTNNHTHTQKSWRTKPGWTKSSDVFTCGRSGHNSECSHGFSTNVVAIEQEAGQVLHVVKLTTQDLLGPLTHQSTGCWSHFIFSARGLARWLHQLTLQSDRREQHVDEHYTFFKIWLDI